MYRTHLHTISPRQCGSPWFVYPSEVKMRLRDFPPGLPRGAFGAPGVPKLPGSNTCGPGKDNGDSALRFQLGDYVIPITHAANIGTADLPVPVIPRFLPPPASALAVVHSELVETIELALSVHKSILARKPSFRTSGGKGTVRN